MNNNELIEISGEVVANPESFGRDIIFAILELANERYYNAIDDDEIFLTDGEYDTIERYARLNWPEHKFFIGTGADVRGDKVALPEGLEMGGLDQLFEGDTEKWVQQYRLRNEKILAGQKYDGTSAMIIYDDDGDLQIAYSRGRGDAAADITRHIRRMKNCPQKVSGAMVVRVEIEVKEQWFLDNQPNLRRRDGTPYKNARNYVAGQMNSSESDDTFYDNVYAVAYTVMRPKLDKGFEIDLLKENGFHTAEHMVFEGHQLNDDMLATVLEQWHKSCEFALDGIVLTVHNREVQQKLTEGKKESSSFRPAYAKKFKVGQADNIAETTVKYVEYDVSMGGLAKPVVVMEPVDLVGVTISRATAYNAKFIVDNGIGPGAKVVIVRSGDVIPKIIKVVESVEPQLPDAEDIGNWHWTESEVDIIIDDLETNDTVKTKQIVSFMNSMEVDFLKESTIGKLYEMGFQTIEDIINLEPSTVRDFGGGSTAEKGAESLKKKLNPVPLWKLAGSGPWFGAGIGRRKFKELYTATGEVLGLSVKQIVEVDGFETKTAEKIVAGYPAFEAFLQAIDGKWTEEVTKKVEGGVFDGQVVVFTGYRNKDAETVIEQQGGKVGSSVSSKTTLVVTKDVNSSSSKIKKARELGIKVIDPEQLSTML